MDSVTGEVKTFKELALAAYSEEFTQRQRDNAARELSHLSDARDAITRAFRKQFPGVLIEHLMPMGPNVCAVVTKSVHLLGIWDGECNVAFHLFQACSESHRCGTVDIGPAIKSLADLGRQLNAGIENIPMHKDHGPGFKVFSPKKKVEKKFVASQAYMLYFSSAITGAASAGNCSAADIDNVIEVADTIAKRACFRTEQPYRMEAE